MENVDTDQLIPARFMSRPRSEGYGQFLLYDLREDPSVGALLDPDHGASVLLAGRNFGSGSSREAAVYALADFGIRVIIAPSFGDIFSANAINNGLLPIPLDPALVAKLGDAAQLTGSEVEVDLNAATIRIADVSASFQIAEIARLKLVNGWDDIDLTLDRRDEIASFRANRAATSWAFPEATATS